MPWKGQPVTQASPDHLSRLLPNTLQRQAGNTRPVASCDTQSPKCVPKEGSEIKEKELRDETTVPSEGEHHQNRGQHRAGLQVCVE